MINVGGMSYSNGICFIGKKYRINFKVENCKAKIFLRKNIIKEDLKIFTLMKKIPFVRAIVFDLLNNKILLMYLLFAIIESKIELSNTNIDTKTSNYVVPIILLTILVFCIVYIIKNRNSFKSIIEYHGAEHKVLFANCEKNDISFETCKESPRVNGNCGSLLFLFTVILVVVLKLLFIILKIRLNVILLFMIAYVIAIELFLLDRNTPVVKWIYKMGYCFQEYILTREPDDLKLSIAIYVFKLLENAEMNKMPKELHSLYEEPKIIDINEIFSHICNQER